MMHLARELKMSLSQVLEMSTLEFRMWAAFLNLEHKKQQGNTKNGNSNRHRR
jgi:hypothetical protein